ncbi:MAG: outer membrane lipoprotein-sorting protein [Ignavibacteria bacterium]|nr:outer membrane lipoprotein-sorting protein [Ignavibacteria bacterium]
MLRKIMFLILLLSLTGFSQSKDPDEILNNIIKAFEEIEDYIVDVNIIVDVAFLKVPEANAKIYFKQPDKIHMESEGFALLPKQGMNFSPLGFLKTDYTALYDKEVELNGTNVSVLKVIPLDERSDVILSTFWIDQSNNRIIKVESSRRPGGTFSIDLIYPKDEPDFLLPATMVFTFAIEDIRFPTGITGDSNSESNNENEKEDKDKSGKVYINYSNYKINQGLSDDLFKDEKE